MRSLLRSRQCGASFDQGLGADIVEARLSAEPACLKLAQSGSADNQIGIQ
jgi:hypothetical protein